MLAMKLKYYLMAKRRSIRIKRRNEAVVQMGIIKMKLPIEDLEKRKKKKKNQRKW